MTTTLRPEISIKCFSWNVGNAEPKEDELCHWLPESDADMYDVVVVGTQECAFKVGGKVGKAESSEALTKAESQDDEDVARESRLSAERSAASGTLRHQMTEKLELPSDANQTTREKDAKLWDSMVECRLGPGYTCVKNVVLWEMRLAVFAKTAWVTGSQKCISNVCVASSATGGPGGLLGNKGGLIIKFTFRGTSFAFISCHLAAHSPQLKKRNENCQEILQETAKSVGSRYLDAVHQFDHVFWLGDLNYRVDLNAGLPTPKYPDDTAHHQAVLALIESQQWSALLQADQLNLCKEQGEAFVGFEEGAATFAPTFKVQRQVGTAFKDQRIPSYCDRVLWKSMPPLRANVVQTSLSSVPAVSTSDHKPVLATFKVRPTEFIGREGGGGPPSFRMMSSSVSKPHITSSSDLTRSKSMGKAGGQRRAFPLIRVKSLEVADLADFDIGGGSDPYCIFYTNPPGLLADDDHAPITTTKSVKARDKSVIRGAMRGSITAGPTTGAASKVPPLEASGVELSPADLGVSPTPSPPDGDGVLAPAPELAGGGLLAKLASPSLRREGSGDRRIATWHDTEVPMLRLRLADASRLPFITLIIAVVDHDTLGKDDPMGCVLVPLAPPDYVPSEGVPHEYTVEVDQPITLGNTDNGIGHLRATLTVSFGDKLDAALQQAMMDKVGADAGTVASKKAQKISGMCCTLS